MSARSIIALALAVIMTVACFAGCTPEKPDPVNPGDATAVPAPTEPPVQGIPDEDLTGMNTSDDPLPDDGNGEAILTRLAKDKLIKNTSADPA
ncbi:MAG: hypothetical protein IKY07_02010, partial [Clostridia bacterium]|nr:hypothetical protein [Clostridia bacterium]